jgi:uncharacterized membrane protein YuzA (DUF378 family)
MKDKSVLDWIAMILVIIGGLNWGLVGLLELDLVELIFGSIPILMKLVYILVGLSALYMIYMVTKK